MKEVGIMGQRLDFWPRPSYLLVLWLKNHFTLLNLFSHMQNWKQNPYLFTSHDIESNDILQKKKIEHSK